MCGDIDEEVGGEEDMMARLLVIAHSYGVAAADLPERPGRAIASDSDRHAYMDELFRDGLARSLGDLSSLPDGERAEGLASQAIVLARLAGLLAGNLPPGSDLLRAAMGAMLDGYDEPARSFAEAADHHHHAHDHLHGHSH